MPFRPAQRPPDLERVARILGSGDEAGPGAPPDGWVPGPPGAVQRLPVAETVRRLASRAVETEEDDDVARLDADLRRARRPGLLTVPDELRSGKRGVSSAAVVALLALVVAVGCAFLLRVLWAERSSSAPEITPGPGRSVEVVGEHVSAATVPTSGATSDGAGSSEPVPSTAGVEVVVHVVGQVVRPGLVRLRQGARVADAIAAAGGTRRGADVSALNLARVVVDGEQVRVPEPGEASVAVPGSAGGSAGGGSPGGGSGGGSAGGAPVSLNTADSAALDSLPGVGPVLAQRILDWRTEHGRFTSVDELGEVSGIGDKLMAQLRPRVTL